MVAFFILDLVHRINALQKCHICTNSINKGFPTVKVVHGLRGQISAEVTLMSQPGGRRREGSDKKPVAPEEPRVQLAYLLPASGSAVIHDLVQSPLICTPPQ